jgi:hypothetical protein
MNDEMAKLLTLVRLPGRLNYEQTAPVLGFHPHEIPVLVKAKLLKPLGNPTPQSVKFFAASDVEKCSRDTDWLNKATKALYSFWATQNSKRAPKRAQTKPALIAA